MKSLARCLSTVAVLALSASLAAAQDGWKIPLWRPFASSSSAKVQNTCGPGSGPMGNVVSAVATGTKKAWNTTVDVVTLKPVRRQFASNPKSDVQLGFKPDPRKKQASSTSWLGSWFKPKKPAGPRTVEEFFSQERPE